MVRYEEDKVLSLLWPLNKMQAYAVLISEMVVLETSESRILRRRQKCFQSNGQALR